MVWNMPCLANFNRWQMKVSMTRGGPLDPLLTPNSTDIEVILGQSDVKTMRERKSLP